MLLKSMGKLEIRSVYNTSGNPCPLATVQLIRICYLHFLSRCQKINKYFRPGLIKK